MDYTKRLSISFYKNIAVLNEAHKIYLVQHQESHKIFVKKILDVYSKQVYQALLDTPVTGTPKIIELFEDNDQLIVIEEYISGETLQEKINHSSLTVTSIQHYMIELCHILEHLHSFCPPIIHRDIKPSNIMITPCDHVILFDFNAAKYYSNDATSDTVLLGTKGYAAPEQYGFGSSSPKTDIYALGVLLEELAASLPIATNYYNSIISKCTMLNPSDRYNSVTELCHALTHEGNNTPIPTSKPRFTRTWLLPPGFRTKNAWHMILACIGYPFIFLISLTLEVNDAPPAYVWLERFFCLFILLSIVLCSCNYCNVQKLFPLCMHKNRIVHFLGVILLDFIVIIFILMLMVILESIFF